MSDYFVTPWTIAFQSPLSMRFSRQEYWNGLPFPSPGDLPNPGIKLVSLALVSRFFATEPPGKPNIKLAKSQVKYVLYCYLNKFNFKTTQKVGSNLELEEQKNQPLACVPLPFSSCPQLHAAHQGAWHTCVWTPSHVHVHPPKLPLNGPGGETHTSSRNRLSTESFKAWGQRHPIKRTEQNI